jgi:hypothetical protein
MLCSLMSLMIQALMSEEVEAKHDQEWRVRQIPRAVWGIDPCTEVSKHQTQRDFRASLVDLHVYERCVFQYTAPIRVA